MPLMLEPNVNYVFPQNRGMGYFLEAHQENKTNRETNRFIFVFTKEQIPFINYDVDYLIDNREDIFSWIYSIMPDQRTLEYHSLAIVK